MFKIEAKGFLRGEREAAARRVLAECREPLPSLSLLSFLDDEDWKYVKSSECAGDNNRGFFTRTREGTILWPDWQAWPSYLREAAFRPDPTTGKGRYRYDCLTYLHGSTCATNIGLTMTLAHEVQHFVQYGSHRRLWAVNTLLNNLLLLVGDVGIKPWEVPFEHEARIAAKRAAVGIHGEENVGQFIDAKIGQTADPRHVSDWEFVRRLQIASSYDLANETATALRSVSAYRPVLQNLLEELRKEDMDFADIQLD